MSFPLGEVASLGAAACWAVGLTLYLALGDSLLFAALARLGPHRAALFGLVGPLLTATGGWLLLD